jgi:hypothetical protein
MEFASEMVMQAGAKDLMIREVPIRYHERKGDTTLDSWRHVKFMLVNVPSYHFTAPALLCNLVDVVLARFSLAGIEIGGVTFGTHTMIVGSLFVII